MLSASTIQSISQQDTALCGKTDGFDYIVVSDAHGYGLRKYALRELIENLDWSKVLSDENWHKNDIDADGKYISPLFSALHSDLRAFSRKVSTKQGCTLSVCMIYPDRFECFTIGDSSIKIWEKCSEEWVRTFVSIDHDTDFTEDISLLSTRKVADARFCRVNWRHEDNGVDRESRGKKIICMSALDTDIMTMKQSAYINFDDGSRLNMTRALGHYPSDTIINIAKLEDHSLSCCEHSLTKVVVERKEGVRYAVIAATDGVWDVTAESTEKTFMEFIEKGDSESIVEKVKGLWEQEWWYDYNGEQQLVTMPASERDDIGCAIAYC